MPTIDDFWFVAEKVARERDGLIVGFTEGNEEPELGSTLDNALGFKSRYPLTVVARADWSDWQQQAESFYRFRPSWGRGKAGDPTGRYYRVRLSKEGPALPGWGAELSLPTPTGPAIPSFSGYATPPQGLMGATFPPRAAARIIDYAIHYVVTFSAGLLFHSILFMAAGGRPPLAILLRISQVRIPMLVAGLLGFLAYHIACTVSYGSTPGKLICSLQVLQDDGSPCRLRSALIREAGYFVDSLFFGLIGYAAMRSTDQQQRYGDEWAGTIVCKRSDVPERSRKPIGRFVIGLMVGALLDIGVLMTGLLIQMNI